MGRSDETEARQALATGRIGDHADTRGQPLTRHAALAISGYEPLDALIAFAGKTDGRVVITSPEAPATAWRVAVEWRSVTGKRERVFGEDVDVPAAALLTQGLLAHALARGVASL